ncbi:arginine--tRNA ligase [Hydrogenophilus thiooxidans]|uniref:arginine--tRNA ligase n=1 Tax=Hydrogenophilus thiooxidans TaxID=2820326 RepID=UPI001C22AE22|nr:arginine--tRNA ligase [Hydrogenophilus thiooxidans]
MAETTHDWTHWEPQHVLAGWLHQAITAAFPDHAHLPVALERPKDPSHGDWATTWALVHAKALKQNPRAVAEAIRRELTPHPWVAEVTIAGPGFLNIRLTPAAKTAVVPKILTARDRFGAGKPRAERVQIEFVSANPTGPLHVGHGRGAAYGATLANVMAFAGWQVTREYYVNDAGRQMDILTLSTWLRYLALFGVAIPFPKNAYQGQYVVAMAETLKQAHGARFCTATAETLLAGVPEEPPAERTDDDATQQREARLDALIANAKRLLGEDYAWLHQFVLTEQLGDCRDDLAEFGVTFDHWFSEQSLYDTGLVARAIETLEKRGHLYTQDGAKWFRATAFGDEKDRVVQRANGSYTYFASDIAYHLNKFERGFDRVIDIWGADHHGYIPRVRAALAALGLDTSRFEVLLVQFAVLYRNGEKVPMSTRAGEFVTLRELRHEVGNDAARFFYILRKSDQHLDFDLDLAKRQSNDNPVYYVQYAHARIASVLREWLEHEPDGAAIDERLSAADLAPLETSPAALALAQRLQAFPAIIATAAEERAPHHIAFYLKAVAADFHAWYNVDRILVEDHAVRLARLALARATQWVLKNGLQLLGVSAPERM